MNIRPELPATARGITRRETLVLQFAADGYNVAQTAFEMALSPHTVTHYIKSAKDKTGKGSITAIVAHAMRNGWIK